jgi:hypothetical protein
MIKKYPYLFISLIGILLFVPFLGYVHLFDWDEINFAEAAREMILTHNYGRVQINFEPFWEKPPLFFWMQVACMKIFGITEFSARLPNAICGILTLNLLFYYGKKIAHENLAWWWVLLYMGSFTPHFYFKSGIIDPWFNLFIFLGIIHLYFGANKPVNKSRHFLFSGLFLGLALLTKGPVALLIVGLVGLVYLLQNKFKWFLSFSHFIILGLSAITIPLLWFLSDWIKNGFWFTNEFLRYQVDLFLHPVASHGQPWYYHPVVLIIGCFPAAILAIPYLFKSNQSLNPVFLKWMKIMFWVVLILFSMVTTKIVHYSSLCYIPLTFIAALGLSQHSGIIKKWQLGLIVMVGLIYSSIFTLIPLIGSSSSLQSYVIGKIKDDFVVANILTPTPWLGWEWIMGLVYILGIITCVFLIKNKSKGMQLLLIGQAAFIFGISALFIPKVENHIQGSMIHFYKSLKNKDIYIETIGFKSYAHYYYTDKKVPKNSDSLECNTTRFLKKQQLNAQGQLNEKERGLVNDFKKDWYLNGKIDKPVYLVYKLSNTQGMDSNLLFKRVFMKGGFVVYRREL